MTTRILKSDATMMLLAQADESQRTIDELVAALQGIAELGDKTLICVADEHGQKCYSDGAHNAFAECASIARAAIAKATGQA